MAQCRCTTEQVQRYRNRVSGPLMDRIDIQVEVPRPGTFTLYPEPGGAETSADVAGRVESARKRQLERQGRPNARLDAGGVRRWCGLGKDQRTLLERAASQLGFSPRGSHRVLKVARTIADLDQARNIGSGHVAEAIALRRLNSGQNRTSG